MDLPDPQKIRELLSDIGSMDANLDSQSLRQTQLIRGGHFCGQRYELGKMKAVWMAGDPTVKIYDASGILVQSVSLSSERDSATRRAA